MGTVSQMLNADPIAHGGENGTFFEPQRINNFHLSIPMLGGGSGAQGESDVISFSLESFDFPKDSNDPIELPFGNESRKVAGKSMVSELSITLKDFCDSGTAESARNWRQKVYNPINGQIGWASNYKTECTLTLFAPNGVAERQFTLIGVWPMDINYGSGDMNGGDYNRIEMTLAIDKYIPGTRSNMRLMPKDGQFNRTTSVGGEGTVSGALNTAIDSAQAALSSF